MLFSCSCDDLFPDDYFEFFLCWIISSVRCLIYFSVGVALFSHSLLGSFNLVFLSLSSLLMFVHEAFHSFRAILRNEATHYTISKFLSPPLLHITILKLWSAGITSNSARFRKAVVIPKDWSLNECMKTVHGRLLRHHEILQCGQEAWEWITWTSAA